MGTCCCSSPVAQLRICASRHTAVPKDALPVLLRTPAVFSRRSVLQLRQLARCMRNLATIPRKGRHLQHVEVECSSAGVMLMKVHCHKAHFVQVIHSMCRLWVDCARRIASMTNTGAYMF